MKKSTLKKYFCILINILFYPSILIISYLFLQVFVFVSFKIPSDSMEPTLIPGDNILVWKPTIGARIFNIFIPMRNERPEIYRIPGIKNIKRNDILVFNFPYPNSLNKIEMNIFEYYIKRCLGLPGDTLSIQNGIFHIKDSHSFSCSIDSQNSISKTFILSDELFHCFPYDSLIGWNIKNFGPFYIPKKNDSILLDKKNYKIYKNIIEWEQKSLINHRDSLIYLKGKIITGYRFKKNYYFMAGDNGMNSQDSRYWGLLPEEYIVGKAWIIWKSVDPYTNEFRWDRFMKVIH